MDPSSDLDAAVHAILQGLSDWDKEIYTRYGEAVSNRMAGESLRRRDLKEVSLDVLDGWRELGYDKPRPTHAQLQERRYGSDWRKIVARHQSRGL